MRTSLNRNTLACNRGLWVAAALGMGLATMAQAATPNIGDYNLLKANFYTGGDAP
jgi:hypothetical protein